MPGVQRPHGRPKRAPYSSDVHRLTASPTASLREDREIRAGARTDLTDLRTELSRKVGLIPACSSRAEPRRHAELSAPRISARCETRARLSDDAPALGEGQR